MAGIIAQISRANWERKKGHRQTLPSDKSNVELDWFPEDYDFKVLHLKYIAVFNLKSILIFNLLLRISRTRTGTSDARNGKPRSVNKSSWISLSNS